jgi:hypothetical protein
MARLPQLNILLLSDDNCTWSVRSGVTFRPREAESSSSHGATTYSTREI